MGSGRRSLPVLPAGRKARPKFSLLRKSELSSTGARMVSASFPVRWVFSPGACAVVSGRGAAFLGKELRVVP